MSRIAVVLFNLGGPDRPSAVRPFLFNLFRDPAIIDLPNPMRFFLAWFLSSKRASIAREIYDRLGGGSPILANSQAQARALQAALSDLGEVACFIAMRYWQPRASEIVQQVKAFMPDRIVLMPLYPHYSTTTTASSLREWQGVAQSAGVKAPQRAIYDYPEQAGFIAAAADLIAPALQRARLSGLPRLLLSAHGLPQRVVNRGDPYPSQIEKSAAAILQALKRPDLESVVCYQSRVGPLKWIGPSTEEEIRKAGAQKRAVVVFPIAFVSDHSETLVEIEIEYRALALKHGALSFERVPAVGDHPLFIQGLADLVRSTLTQF